MMRTAIPDSLIVRRSPEGGLCCTCRLDHWGDPLDGEAAEFRQLFAKWQKIYLVIEHALSGGNGVAHRLRRTSIAMPLIDRHQFCPFACECGFGIASVP